MFEERLSDSDALLWTINRDPVLRNTITAVVLLDRAPDFEILAKRLDALTREVPRLRSRVVTRARGWGPPWWREDPHFELDLHLHHVVAPAPATLRTALDAAQVLATTSFDPELALWEALVIDGLEGGRAAFVIKVHHAVIDGVGGLAVAARILDLERDPGAGPDAVRQRGPGPARRPGAGAPGNPLGSLVGTLGALGGLSARAVGAAAGALVHPAAAVTDLRATGEAVVRLLAPTPRPRSSLLVGRSLARRFEVIDLPSGALRRAGAAAGGTLNDAFVAGILGGLRHYHQLHGYPAGELRIMMPVSIRRPSDPVETNRFVPARFLLPADEADPSARVAEVHERAGVWKHSPGLGLTDVMAGVLNRLPAAAATSAFAMMLKGSDFVATNVPGALDRHLSRRGPGPGVLRLRPALGRRHERGPGHCRRPDLHRGERGPGRRPGCRGPDRVPRGGLRRGPRSGPRPRARRPGVERRGPQPTRRGVLAPRVAGPADAHGLDRDLRG